MKIKKKALQTMIDIIRLDDRNRICQLESELQSLKNSLKANKDCNALRFNTTDVSTKDSSPFDIPEIKEMANKFMALNWYVIWTNSKEIKLSSPGNTMTVLINKDESLISLVAHDTKYLLGYEELKDYSSEQLKDFIRDNLPIIF